MKNYTKILSCHSSAGWNLQQDYRPNYKIPNQVWDDNIESAE